jgi:site-specific DNA-methyltransferase (adenine-specific)
VSGFDRIIVGDAGKVLASLPADSVDCVVTSPPYFRLRNYQHLGQIGLEEHVDQWVERLREILREARRVLAPSGSLWLNLGDTYSTGKEGAPAKSLLMAPERVALALIEDGWILRNKVIWAKTNPMPSAVKDRLSCTYEVVYFAVKQPHYHFDLDAIRIPHLSTRQATKSRKPAWSVPEAWRGPALGENKGLDRLKAAGLPGHPLGKNPGDVWPLATASYAGNHHAVFPLALTLRPIQSTCPERRCSLCHSPWISKATRDLGRTALRGMSEPSCNCGAPFEPGVVLDPFMGSGTVAIAAERLGRAWLGIELNPAFAAQAERRIDEARSNLSNERKEVA